LAETTKQGLLRRAASILGRETLAVRLKVPSHLLDAWINGHATMPDRKLVMLADILGEIAYPRQG
jgi:hypothetical protein